MDLWSCLFSTTPPPVTCCSRPGTETEGPQRNQGCWGPFYWGSIGWWGCRGTSVETGIQPKVAKVAKVANTCVSACPFPTPFARPCICSVVDSSINYSDLFSLAKMATYARKCTHDWLPWLLWLPSPPVQLRTKAELPPLSIWLPFGYLGYFLGYFGVKVAKCSQR